MIFSGKTILLLSPEKWGTNFVSKHHYANLLASKGNIVYFLNPPGSKINLEKISNNLFVINYKMPRGVNRLPRIIKKAIHRIVWNNIKKKLYLQIPEIVWSFDPYVFQDLSLFNENAIKIYHPVDVHYTDLDYECANTANYIFSTTHLILRKFERSQQKCFFINHGLAWHFYDQNYINKTFLGIIDSNKFKVGYVGNLQYQHLNYQVLFQIIDKYPEINFYFLGPYANSNLKSRTDIFEDEINTLRSYKNVFLLGSRESTDIPAFLSKMDLLIMAYETNNKIAEMANPHKILEYLSSGKKILTHFIYEYQNKEQLLYMVKDSASFSEKFSEVLEKRELSIIKNERIQFSLDNTYEKQLERISSIIFK